MAAPVIPASVQLATIEWLWTAAIGDETTVPTGLTVTFDPAPEWLQYTAATPHMTIAPWSVTATIGTDGTLLGPDGTANVTLLPTDDTNLNPSAWTYQVTVRQGPLILMSFPIAAPGGVTTDLTTVTPIAGSTGNAVIVGPPGPPNTLTPGTATTGAPGTDMSFSITGEAPNQVLNLTIPRGDAGSVTAVAGVTPDGAGNVPLTPAEIGAAAAASALGVPVTSQTAAYTLVAGDAGSIVEVNSASAANVTVPASIFTAGQIVEVCQYGAGQVTIVAGSGVTLRNAGGLKISAQYGSASIRFRSATEAVVSGSMTT